MLSVSAPSVGRCRGLGVVEGRVEPMSCADAIAGARDDTAVVEQYMFEWSRTYI